MRHFCFFSLIIVNFICASSSLAAELVMFESEACEWCEVWDEEIGVAYDKTQVSTVVPLRKVDIGGINLHPNFRCYGWMEGIRSYYRLPRRRFFLAVFE